MFSTTTRTAAPIAQEQQHHQAGEDRAERAFGGDAPHGPCDVGRLVELEAQLDVLGQGGLHLRQVRLDRLTTARVEASARLLTSM